LLRNAIIAANITKPSAERTAVAGLVERVLAAKRATPAVDVAALEQEIDAHVYRLYGLTQDEIKLVESASAGR